MVEIEHQFIEQTVEYLEAQMQQTLARADVAEIAAVHRSAGNRNTGHRSTGHRSSTGHSSTGHSSTGHSSTGRSSTALHGAPGTARLDLAKRHRGRCESDVYRTTGATLQRVVAQRGPVVAQRERVAAQRAPVTEQRGPARPVIISRRPSGTRCAGTVTRTARSTTSAVVASLTGVALALVVWMVAVAGGDYQESATPTPAATEVTHVRAGESLSAVAARVAPGLPQETVVATIMKLNDMSSSALRVGQALVTPSYH